MKPLKCIQSKSSHLNYSPYYPHLSLDCFNYLLMVSLLSYLTVYSLSTIKQPDNVTSKFRTSMAHFSLNLNNKVLPLAYLTLLALTWPHHLLHSTPSTPCPCIYSFSLNHVIIILIIFNIHKVILTMSQTLF